MYNSKKESFTPKLSRKLNRRVIFPQPSFEIPLADAGSGVVSTTPSFGTGSATFTRATTATTRLSNGLLASVASGSPRSYYSPSGVYLGYLAEGARTNLCLQSQTFGTTWVLNNTTLSADAAAAPDGTTTADLIYPSTSGTNRWVQQNFTNTVATYTNSFYVKPNSSWTWVYILKFNAGAGGAWFNLQTGAVGTVASGSATMTAEANGWYRCTFTDTSLVAATCYIGFSDADNSLTATANGTSGAYLWGAQNELGAFASTYIPTTTVAVTRNADVLSYPSSGNISTTEGVVAMEFTPNDADTGGKVTISSFVDGSNNWYNIATSSTLFLSRTVAASGTSASIAYTPANGTKIKMASRWGADGLNIWKDTVKGTPSVVQANMPIATNLQVGALGGGTQPFGSIKNLKIWNKALSDSDLVRITS